MDFKATASRGVLIAQFGEYFDIWNLGTPDIIGLTYDIIGLTYDFIVYDFMVL